MRKRVGKTEMMKMSLCVEAKRFSVESNRVFGKAIFGLKDAPGS
jgi:hypothetical protein